MPKDGLTLERILALAGTGALLLVALIIVVMIAGGGDDDEQAASPQPAPEVTPQPEAEEEEPEPTPEPDPGPPPLTAEQEAERDDAAEVVRTEGYEPRRLSSWRGDHTLRVLFGEPLDGPEGTLRAFFFVAGDLVGSDAPEASSDVDVARARRNQTTLEYQLWEPGDTDEPSGETATVRFRWDGGALQTRDEVPPATERRPPGT
jgi:hypothetical protein